MIKPFKVFVAEKPDVARELSAFLGKKNAIAPKKEQRFISVGDEIVVTWARGHLLEQAQVDEYFPEIRKDASNSSNNRLFWSCVPLPILPKKFIYKPSAEDADRSAQLKEIGRLMRRATEIYNAADRDREGQLIFDEIVEHFEISGKPIKRLIFSSLDDQALERAMATCVDNSTPSVFNAGLAARARGQADWLIGMNGTRAMTLAHVPPGSRGGFLSVGRVMTPTMSVVVRRHLEIQNFKSSAFFVPVVELPDGTIMEWKSRSDGDATGLSVDGKIVDRTVADRIVRDINSGLEGEITESKSTERKEEPPLPFSLPSIQSELAKKYGLTIDEITKACQSLYEKKMQTYVGTDCPYLPEAMHGEALSVLDGLRGGAFQRAIGGADIKRKYGCWDDKKLSGEGGAAHHAIIPTGNRGSLDSEAEKLVYQAVCNRYIAQFHPEHRYLSISLKAAFGSNEFSASAKAVLSNGWKDVDGDVASVTEDTGRVAPDMQQSGHSQSQVRGEVRCD